MRNMVQKSKFLQTDKQMNTKKKCSRQQKCKTLFCLSLIFSVSLIPKKYLCQQQIVRLEHIQNKQNMLHKCFAKTGSNDEHF